MVALCQIPSPSACTNMMLITLHIVAIGTLIGITANFAYSMGKKDGLRIARKEQEDKKQNNEAVKIESK